MFFPSNGHSNGIKSCIHVIIKKIFFNKFIIPVSYTGRFKGIADVNPAGHFSNYSLGHPAERGELQVAQLAGCAKVYPSRTEMLRELNTTGIPTHDALRRQKLQSLKRKTLTRLREVCFLRACLCS